MLALLDLQAEVARRWQVEVHESTIGNWLHELGLRHLQPRPVHPKKDAEAETVFKKISPVWCAPPFWMEDCECQRNFLSRLKKPDFYTPNDHRP
jgi:hypothetical protein